ncbi:MAG: hypothetical protein ACTSQE_15945 [Candidatus Heimdallarchaeaceae archaeon]
MIRLKNLKKEQIEYEITRVPLSNSRKGSKPVLIEDIKNPGEKIPDPNLLTPLDKIVIRAGETVKFEGKGEDKAYNEEQAEYLYKTLGSIEDGGSLYPGGPRVTSSNFLIEVDEKGEEIKTNLFKKYRIPHSPAVAQNIQRVVEE